MYILIVFLFSPPSLLISIRLSSTWTHSHFTSTNRLSLDAGDHSRHRSAPTCTISHCGGLYRRSRDRVTGQHSTRIIPIDRWKRSLYYYCAKIIIIIIIITSKQNTQTKKKKNQKYYNTFTTWEKSWHTHHAYIYINFDILHLQNQHHKITIYRYSTVNTTFTTVNTLQHYNHSTSTLLLLQHYFYSSTTTLLLLYYYYYYYYYNHDKKNCITSRKKP